MKAVLSIPVLIVCVLCVAAISLLLGPVSIDLMSILSGRQSGFEQIVLFDVRLPRIILNIIVGAGVAMSGAAIQGLFRNPLADPALIGVSSGAALFAAAFMVFGLEGSILGQIGISGSAFAGGLLATAIVLLVGQKSKANAGILLAGIAVNAVALSGIGLFSYLSSDAQLRSVAFWALGSFGAADWHMVLIAFSVVPLMGMLYFENTRLNAITLGDEEARQLGIDVKRLRYKVIFYTAFIVSISVSLVGVISFIGLVVPHLVRLSIGSSHKILLPCSALLGASVVLVADSISRVVFAPAELPVGILLAMVGGPFFIFLIVTQKGHLNI